MAAPHTGTMEIEEQGQEVPGYIHYMLSAPPSAYTCCWFLVGNPDIQPPELMMASKVHVMAHSVPFRSMLEESDIAEKGTEEDPVKIIDIKPEAFRRFIMFVNGHNDVSTMILPDAVDLICVAEKYIVPELKSKLGKQITSLVEMINIYLPMNTPECFEEDRLKRYLDMMIQGHTQELMTNKEFHQLNAYGLLKIVTQDELEVPELELWNYVIDWAKHKAESEEGKQLREVLGECLKHIRFCTLSPGDFTSAVASTDILTDREILTVVKIIGGSTMYREPTICCELEPRKLATKYFEYPPIDFTAYGFLDGDLKMKSYMYLTTGFIPFYRLHSATIESPECPYRCAPRALTFQCQCEVLLTKITNYQTNASSEEPFKFDFLKEVQYETEFDIPFPETMQLEPSSKYKLEFRFSQPMPCMVNTNTEQIVEAKYRPRISWDFDGRHFPRTHVSKLVFARL